MSQIILNEKVYAEECLNGEHIGEHTMQTLSILARYYYHEKGYRKKRIYTLLMEYLQDNRLIGVGEKIMWEERVEKQARNAWRYKLLQINGVNITKGELDTIDSIEGKTLRRLAFTMLCLAKLGNAKNEKNNGWVHTDAKEIFRLARISCSAIDRDIKIGRLYRLGLLDFAKRNDDLSCRVTFIDNESDVVLFISDFRELGYEYLKYCGENFVRCRECGVLMRGNKNNTKTYCKDCAAPTVMGTKKVVCIDCGDEFEVSAKNNRSKRCPFCYDLYRREYYRIAKQEMRQMNNCPQNKKKMTEKMRLQNPAS